MGSNPTCDLPSGKPLLVTRTAGGTKSGGIDGTYLQRTGRTRLQNFSVIGCHTLEQPGVRTRRSRQRYRGRGHQELRDGWLVGSDTFFLNYHKPHFQWGISRHFHRVGGGVCFTRAIRSSKIRPCG